MNYALGEIFSYSIAIGAIIGLVRIKKIDQVYFPFIILLWAGLLNEIIGTICINEFNSNAINSNIYVLIESFLLLWLFKKWGLFRTNKKLLISLYVLFASTWVAVNFIIFSIQTSFSSHFNILYSLITVLMSIQIINRLFLEEKGRLVKNSKFLISIGFIVYYTCNILVEIFYVYGLDASDNFGIEVYRIMIYINLVVNLIFALAVLWIPRKREFTLL